MSGCGVGSPDEMCFCFGDVVVRWRWRVATKGLVVSGDRRGHTESSVGVVVSGTKAAAGKLAEHVGGLIGLLPTPEHRNAVG